MISISLRAAAAAAALVALPLVASAAPKPFTGPASGWDHTVGMTPTAQTPRSLETWKKSDGEYVTYLEDAGLSYDDTLAAVKKNLTDNSMTAAIDSDRKCDGRRAHEFEMTFGTTTVHQLIVDDAPGLTKITFARPQGKPAPADVLAAINAYCGAQ